MREIKFRCWYEGNMSSSFTLSAVSETDCDEDNIEWETKLRLGDIMQFTGLKDKNGKEIYEGDIFKWYSRKCDSTDKWENIAEVKFKDGSYVCGMERKFTCDCAYLDVLDFRYFEVIGNIYENQELLASLERGKR